MRLKVLDRLFLRGFIGPCLLAFFVVEFVLIMQNLWKVIDDILGKGYGLFDYLELLYYFAVAIIPMALPLTILLSSVMVYGDMAEKYELSSAKSSGISFTRMLYPGFIVSILVFSFSLVASNYLKPKANEGFHKKIRDMKTNKLTFVFDEKIFNKEFKNYSIRIGKKESDGQSIRDVMIYDHSDSDDSVLNMIRAKSGKMYTTRDVKYLIMDLEEGYHVKEIRSESADRSDYKYNDYARPVMRYSFSSLRKTFDLAEVLDLNVVNISYKQHEMMNTNQLIKAIDSIHLRMDELRKGNVHEFNLFIDPDSTYRKPSEPTVSTASLSQALKEKARNPSQSSINRKKEIKKAAALKSANLSGNLLDKNIVRVFPEQITDSTESLAEISSFPDLDRVLESMRRNTLALKQQNSNSKQEERILEAQNKKFIFELHQMYSFALVCILFLFIGAPSGAIVRKGGFGYPVLIAIGFYLTFIMSSIFGEKLMASGALSPSLSAWLPCLLLAPFALYLSWRALQDNRPLIGPFLKKIAGFIPLVRLFGRLRMGS